jgi:uncharacterized protein
MTSPSSSATQAANFDLQAQIAGLYVYPIKSCAGIALPSTTLTATGLAFDRQWMVIDAASEFVTQRELPRMALITPALEAHALVLQAPGMAALRIAFDHAGTPCQASVWSHVCKAFDMGDEAAQWLSEFLAHEKRDGTAGQPATPSLRLVRFDQAHRRRSNTRWTAGVEALNQFSDGYPMLVLSQASLDGLNQRLHAQGIAPVGIERFRPNIVLSGTDEHDEDRIQGLHILGDAAPIELALVKPCPRCPIPNIDPLTALSHPAVSDTLQTYRQDSRVDDAVTFGMNAIALQGVGQTLRVGQAVGANFAF